MPIYQSLGHLQDTFPDGDYTYDQMRSSLFWNGLFIVTFPGASFPKCRLHMISASTVITNRAIIKCEEHNTAPPQLTAVCPS